MDKEILLKWKPELEANLADLERQISQLNTERVKIQSQLAAVGTLLSATGKVMANQTISTEPDATSNFLSSLKMRGWSISYTHKRANIHIASRMGESINLWTKFSRHHERPDGYWFGITPDSLAVMINEKGGVALLLGTPNDYVCFSFKKLQELLHGATPAKTGQKFYIRKRGGKVELLPIGTDQWIDVSPFVGTDGLKGIGLAN